MAGAIRIRRDFDVRYEPSKAIFHANTAAGLVGFERHISAPYTRAGNEFSVSSDVANEVIATLLKQELRIVAEADLGVRYAS